MDEEKKDLLQVIAEVRKEFREERMIFQKYLLPFVRELLEYGAANFPEEKFRELVEKTRTGMAEAREKIKEVWNEQSKEIIALVNKQFQEPRTLEEIKKRGLAIIGLTEEVFLTITDELKLIELTEAELDRFIKK